MKHIFSFPLLLTFCTVSLYAQNFQADYARMAQAYNQLTRWKTEIVMTAYESHEGMGIIEESKGWFARNGNAMSSSYGGQELLVNEQYAVIVNHRTKFLAVDRMPDRSSIGNPASLQMDGHSSMIENMIPDAGTWLPREECIDAGSKVVAWKLLFPTGQYTRLDVYMNAGTYLLEKVVMYMREPMPDATGSRMMQPRLEIRYGRHLTGTAVPLSDFSESKYFTILPSGKISLHAPLPGYKVINHLLADPRTQSAD